ncbi:RTA1 domain-containing protein [Colletotrichum orchidophilum]|uniref:RTA1 domain-containing protein n=1 Tax=Colletotrichum orchidophilum TaxID=1209926 RepID=A0A1G4BGM8_9PEZI|nr:RTA1 domain-containing protein [Colletotrichum orchidophilum]OHF00539.1 RTA1 domain-containing protein [Colletotrichum orchidophilum]
MATLSSTPTFTSASAASVTSSDSLPSCTTAVPGKYGHVPIDACNSYYAFDPSFEGNTVFAVLFGLSFVAHIAQAIMYRKRFCWVLCVGASWELTAFILRSLGARDQQRIGYQIGGQLLFLLAPLWINAFAYMLSARLVYFVLPDQKVFRLRATALTKIFVTMDVVCFLVQGAGGSMMSNTEATSDDPILRAGKQVYMTGCGLQLAFIVVFCGLMGRFYVKMRQAQRFDLNLKRIRAMVLVMFVVLVLIIIRIIFRLAEFGPGANMNNPILTNENYAFGLDALPMLLALGLLNAVHPGIVLRGDNSEFPRLSLKEKKQVKLERKTAKKESKLAEKAAKGQKKAGLDVDDGDYVAIEEITLAAEENESEVRTGARGAHV